TTTEAPTTTPPPPTTTEPPAPPPPPPPPPPPAGHTDQVVALVNQARAAAGCRALTVDDRLTAAAQGHSEDMARQDYFSHTSLDGRTFADRIRAAGYPSPAAENIAKGQRSAQQVHDAWMNSAGHRANILNCSYTTIGVGLDPDGWYWTQNFGR
ncbi:MAG TPA: CAP domain-containing protein, partial [Pseudonocardiaceae bacterium]